MNPENGAKNEEEFDPNKTGVFDPDKLKMEMEKEYKELLSKENRTEEEEQKFRNLSEALEKE